MTSRLEIRQALAAGWKGLLILKFSKSKKDATRKNNSKLPKSKQAKKGSTNQLVLDNIKLIDELSIDGDFIESQAFAYLAIRSFLKLPISFPSTTGCKRPTTGGVYAKNY